MDPDATVTVHQIPVSEDPLDPNEAQVRVRDVLEALLGGEGDVQEGPLDIGTDADYLLAQGAEAVVKDQFSVEELIREIAQDIGMDLGSDDKDVNGGLAFERDFAIRQAKLAKAALQIVKWSLNENRPLRALDAANNELDRLDEELDGLDALGEARDD